MSPGWGRPKTEGVRNGRVGLPRYMRFYPPENMLTYWSANGPGAKCVQEKQGLRPLADLSRTTGPV